MAAEGFTDLDALVSFAQVLSASGDLNGFDQSRVFWTIGGGSTLRDWVERRYLESLGIPQVYIFDSDRTAAEHPPAREKVDRVAEINNRPNCKAFLMRKRAIENYMHPDTVNRLSGGKITYPANVDLEFGDVPVAFGGALAAAKAAHGNQLGFIPEDHFGNRLGLGTSESKAKKIITSYVMRHMTPAEIRARGSYTDPATGLQGNEIAEWLAEIRRHL